MIFRETNIPGAFVVEPQRLEDSRGFFARTWCQREAAAQGVAVSWVQCNISYNREKGTLRGMHYQIAPYEEAKLVRCTMGAIFDVMVDLRPGSPAYKQHFVISLTAQNRTMVYIPTGVAHGFLTLEDESEVFYQMSEFYSPEHARGVRWNDPAFAIPWPAEARRISERDNQYPDWASRNPLE